MMMNMMLMVMVTVTVTVTVTLMMTTVRRIIVMIFLVMKVAMFIMTTRIFTSLTAHGKTVMKYLGAFDVKNTHAQISRNLFVAKQLFAGHL